MTGSTRSHGSGWVGASKGNRTTLESLLGSLEGSNQKSYGRTDDRDEIELQLGAMTWSRTITQTSGAKRKGCHRILRSHTSRLLKKRKFA